MIQSLPLPSMERVAVDRSNALAEHHGDTLTLALNAPPTSISARTRTIETFSPLFRESSANLQSNLFPDMPAANPTEDVSAGVDVRYFALCNGQTVQLGEFGLCPICSIRHKTLRRIRYSKQPKRHGCDARCMAALGPNCECACGGANHGRWNDTPATATETELF